MTSFALTEAATGPGPGFGGLAAAVLVLAVLAGAAWLVRRGSLRFGPIRRNKELGFSVETAFSLGERRSLAVITVEGRRLLLGLTPAHISLITELPAAASMLRNPLEAQMDNSFQAALSRHEDRRPQT